MRLMLNEDLPNFTPSISCSLERALMESVSKVELFVDVVANVQRWDKFDSTNVE